MVRNRRAQLGERFYLENAKARSSTVAEEDPIETLGATATPHVPVGRRIGRLRIDRVRRVLESARAQPRIACAVLGIPRVEVEVAQHQSRSVVGAHDLEQFIDLAGAHVAMPSPRLEVRHVDRDIEPVTATNST